MIWGFTEFRTAEQVNRNRWSYSTNKGEMADCMFTGKFKINKI